MAKQNENTAAVCPEGNDRVECNLTPSITGKSMFNPPNTIDGRGARIRCFKGVTNRVATNCPKSIITEIFHFFISNNNPAIIKGTQPPTSVKYLKKTSSTGVWKLLRTKCISTLSVIAHITNPIIHIVINEIRKDFSDLINV